MSDIHNLLSKYFLGEASPEESILVEQFKQENQEEYEILEAFWTKKGLEYTKFNTEKAWQKVAQNSQPPKRVLMYSYLRRVAAVAAILLSVTAGFYFYKNQPISPELSIITAKLQNDKIILADGSIVYLNKHATLSFPKQFDANKRELTLYGEAFFEVAKDANRPFLIHTNHSDVEVLGTSFNVNTTIKQTEVSVATGKVKVQASAHDKSSILTPGQTAEVTEQTLKVYTTINQNYLAWKTGIFEFNETPIVKVVKDLNTYYDNKIQLTKSDIDCSFTSTFKQRDLKEIIEIIELSCGLQNKQKNEHYELY